jgi:glutaminyl-tRNA synthetase
MSDTSTPVDFIRQIITEDQKSGKHGGKVATRFPPEPNGYLHVGHAKSICLNFGIAQEFEGTCNLRFDDTNPEAEDTEYVDAIKEDVEWLGFKWNGKVRYASDYFDQLHDYAVQLIKLGKAYVDSLNAEQMREYRGTLKEPGKNSPYRDRSIEENLQLFADMRGGKFNEGECILRAKIDMASPNINMRDPAIYRIRKATHHQTGDKWCIYPMYDFTHCLSDMIEGITHSLCTTEFEDHRPLYDWVLDTLKTPCHPQQIEFARLNLNFTITSKRKLKELIQTDLVKDWDDPRMPTIKGMRRRGYTSAALRNFCKRIGITKSVGIVEMETLEFDVRDDLDHNAPRAMCVLRPLKVVIESYAEGKVEELTAHNHPQKPEMGSRIIPMTREIFIDQADFDENPPKGYKRLTAGGEVRLRGSYVIKCEQVVKDANGNIVELRCSHDANTLGKNPEGRKVGGVIHWVSATRSLPCEVRLYDRLFNVANPDGDKEKDFKTFINPASLEVLTGARCEESVGNVKPETHFQFEREGYFCADREDCKPGHLVFNRTVTLRDSWGKEQGK